MLIDNPENQQKIIDNFLEISAFEGWSNESLRLAIIKSGIDEKYLELLFEDKIYSLISLITRNYWNKLILIVNNNPDFIKLKISQKISYLIYNFITIDQKNKISHQRLLNFYLMPQGLIKSSSSTGLKPFLLALNQSYFVADFMWNYIGDKSTDINFFSKRIILSKIISRSFIFYLKNDDLSLLQKFIDDQIVNILKFSSFKSQVKSNFYSLKNKVDDALSNSENFNFSIQNFHKKIPFFRLINKNFFK